MQSTSVIKVFSLNMEYAESKYSYIKKTDIDENTKS